MNKFFINIVLALSLIGMLTVPQSAVAQKKVKLQKSFFTERPLQSKEAKKMTAFTGHKIKFNFVVKHTFVVDGVLHFNDPKYTIKITRQDSMRIDSISSDKNRIYTSCNKDGVTYSFRWDRKDDFYFLDQKVSAVGKDFKVSGLKVRSSESCKLRVILQKDRSETNSTDSTPTVETVERE
jgi:hypothetical protein